MVAVGGWFFNCDKFSDRGDRMEETWFTQTAVLCQLSWKEAELFLHAWMVYLHSHKHGYLCPCLHVQCTFTIF